MRSVEKPTVVRDWSEAEGPKNRTQLERLSKGTNKAEHQSPGEMCLYESLSGPCCSGSDVVLQSVFGTARSCR